MILFLLFKEFFKIGLFSVGGGYATLPFLLYLSERYSWYSVEELNQKIEELIKNRDELQGKYDELTNQNRELTKKYAFTSRNIRPELYSDIETYFKGKGLDINDQTLNEELKTHGDWCNKTNTIVSLGSETKGSSAPSEREFASKIFGVDL